MKYEDALAAIDYSGVYIVTLMGGTKMRMRLFIYGGRTICKYAKRKRNRGYAVSTEVIEKFWKSIDKPTPEDPHKRWRHNAAKVVKYLEASGLWEGYLQDLKKALTLSDEELFVPRDEPDYYHKISEKFEHLSVDGYFSLFQKDGVRTVNWGHHKDYKERVAQAMANKSPLTLSWTVSYDNSIEYAPDKKRAWYSEEYRGCGNGHYYLMLDAEHVGFCEDD